MRRIAFLFVLTLVLGLVPAMADIFTWTVGGAPDAISGSGTLTATAITPAGLWAIDSLTGQINGNAVNIYGPGGCSDCNLTWRGVPGTGGANIQYNNVFFGAENGVLDEFGIVLYAGNINAGNASNAAPFWYIAGTYPNPPASGPPGYLDNTNLYGFTVLSNPFLVSAVPDGGTTLSLLGLALVGLAGLRRKLSL